MTEPEKTQTETTSLHMHDHHANSQSKVKVKIGGKYAKSITILWLRIVIKFFFFHFCKPFTLKYKLKTFRNSLFVDKVYITSLKKELEIRSVTCQQPANC